MSAQQATAADTLRFIRNAALCCVIGGLIATVGASVTALIPSSVPLSDVSSPYTPALFRFVQILWAISYALIMIGIVGLSRSNAIGPSMLGKIGLWLALVGQGALVVGNVAFAFFATATKSDPAIVFLDSLMGMASLVTAIGFVLVGIAVLRWGRWQGWQRFVPLLCGLFVPIFLLPILTLLPQFFHWPVAGWGACFVLLGIALYQQAPLASNNEVENTNLDRHVTVTSEAV